MGSSFEGIFIVVLVLYAATIVFPCWRIISRTGLPGALGLLALIPLVNLILLWVLAFIDWPALKKTGTANV
ncbi:hypothetical protein [Hyphobacterium sp.]|uniref:hypothetical protein n=1 Tax=Hyphobacterium sp. TaxID=2004662 RepID=UPI003BA9E588